MNNRKVPFRLADPNTNVYNAADWEHLQTGIANAQFTAVEIKAFYAIGLILEICASVDCLLKADSPSENGHPLAYQVFSLGGRYLPAFGVFASGIELLGRCLTGNDTAQVNENLRVGFHYLASPDATPLLNNIPVCTEVVATSRSYTIQDLIDLRNYAAHGQSAVGQRDATGRLVPMSSPPGIEGELFTPLPRKMGGAVGTYWAKLQNDANHCTRLARARIDPYSNRIGPLQHVVGYFGRTPYQPASSLFDRFTW